MHLHPCPQLQRAATSSTTVPKPWSSGVPCLPALMAGQLLLGFVWPREEGTGRATTRTGRGCRQKDAQHWAFWGTPILGQVTDCQAQLGGARAAQTAWFGAGGDVQSPMTQGEMLSDGDRCAWGRVRRPPRPSSAPQERQPQAGACNLRLLRFQLVERKTRPFISA